MKTLLVCYSMSGNVADVCADVASRCGADVLRIEPEKAYPDKGMKKFLWGGKSALMGEKPPLKPYEVDWDAYDCIGIAYPVWASTYPPPIATFLDRHAEQLKTKSIAALACYAGSGAEKSLSKLRAALGVDRFCAEATVQDPYPKKPEIGQQRAESIRRFAEALQAKEN